MKWAIFKYSKNQSLYKKGEDEHLMEVESDCGLKAPSATSDIKSK